MNDPKRPLGVTILACLYIAVGVVGFVYHLSESLKRAEFGWDSVLVELSESLAVLFGAFMLRGRNWARWGALAWMLFHVILSAFHALHEFAIHAVFAGNHRLASLSSRRFALFSRSAKRTDIITTPQSAADDDPDACTSI